MGFVWGMGILVWGMGMLTIGNGKMEGMMVYYNLEVYTIQELYLTQNP